MASMPATAQHTRREKSHRSHPMRTRSQPAVEHRRHTPPSPPSSHPMKNFIGNLLQVTPHRYVSPFNTAANRSKISSSLSTAIPSDRSSRNKVGHPSLVSSFSVRSTNVQSPREIRPPLTKLTVKFRRAGNLILFAIYWCNFARKKNYLRSMIYQSYLQTAAPTEKYMFDKSNFKIQSFEILPIVQQFFKQPSETRDVINADQIRQCLVDVKPFTRLPKGLQDQFLRKAWYECYPEQRTIVRQGERSTCFYIVLSGSAIPTYKRATDGNIETLDVLKRGCTFGEKGLMTDSTQNFTVMSKTKLELLALWKDDFQSIFMSNDRHCSRDDIRFLKNHVSVLRGFPVEQLHDIPNAIQHCSFGPSEVIAKDSRRMKHLFVVKKGSLAIWKRLDANGYNRETTKINIERTDHDKLGENEDEATGDNRTLFSEIQLSGDINESTLNTNAIDADFRLSRLRRTPIDDQRIPSASSSSTISRTIAKNEQKFPGLTDKRDRLQVIDYDELPPNEDLIKPTLSHALSKLRPIKQTIKPKLIHPTKMIYVHVKTLNEGQQFGLTDMIFPNQPALTLISNECECLLLNKSSFLHLASDQYKQNIRRSEIPFPTDSVFYKTYHTNEVWKRFSKQVYLDAYERIQQQHPHTVKRSMNINKKNQPILIGAA